ncbi:MAG: hypothetical protein A2158_07355 [Chloroflexi bacterium RBG_13_46_14]|nr:MAG: hypothetical protein A2158_07355 [Chloroflexi bacterium RBG_13_46_14]
MITQDEAIGIARKEIEGKIEIEENAPITAELENNQYIVTFGCILPPDTLGPDYAARVTIDAISGKIVNVLAGTD